MKRSFLTFFAATLMFVNIFSFTYMGSVYGAVNKNIRSVEYKCSRCGIQVMRDPQQGRPEPGRCPRNGYKRHSWTINRKFYHAGAAPKRKYNIVEYKCKFCGVQRTMGVGNGKPEPGRCQRRSGFLPHSWLINRKW